jgi:hypothetical protein
LVIAKIIYNKLKKITIIYILSQRPLNSYKV